MDETIKKKLSKDPDGLLTYEYIANNIENLGDTLPELIDNMIRVDQCGQFCVSAARYLNAIAAERHAPQIDTLIRAAIDKDRDRAYIGQLLPDIWGADYAERVDELNAADDNFRRIYKRIFPTGI
ncbi:MAG: hypothetical protein NC111_01355 [Bacteroides sp.]|nr:hypothetical protein [Bacteroides sp.]MCM1413622.1 hypothetical protein [Bacteroides sp.]MCM1471161.1 hypothetical protein [Bacteroides sp.]